MICQSNLGLSIKLKLHANVYASEDILHSHKGKTQIMFAKIRQPHQSLPTLTQDLAVSLSLFRLKKQTKSKRLKVFNNNNILISVLLLVISTYLIFFVFFYMKLACEITTHYTIKFSSEALTKRPFISLSMTTEFMDAVLTTGRAHLSPLRRILSLNRIRRLEAEYTEKT